MSDGERKAMQKRKPERFWTIEDKNGYLFLRYRGDDPARAETEICDACGVSWATLLRRGYRAVEVEVRRA